MGLVSSSKVLLIDAGSSWLKWGWHSHGHLSAGGRAEHEGCPESLIGRMAEQGRPSRVLVASVMSSGLSERFATGLGNRFQLEPEFAQSGTRGGVINGYDDAEQLGIDRWLGLIAAHAERKGPSVVVDCGTAVTVDVVDGAGRHLGGHILPGIGLMYRCLTANTRLDPERIAPRGLLGHDTASCVANGIHFSVAAMVDRLAELWGSDASAAGVIMTGGDAKAVASMMNKPKEIRPDLVLEGLALWAGLNVAE